MPLDPFFAERLRVHRRYLIGRVLADLRARLRALWPFAREAVAPASADASAATRAEKTDAAPAALGPRARARAKHRRAALAWDRKELETAGIPGPEVRIAEHTIDVPGRPAVRVRVYDPRVAERSEPLPACLTFFGGAFRIGGIDYPTTDAANRRRAVDADIVVVAVDYALAPEHRYPTQVFQGYAALEWLFESAGRLGVDPERIGIGGASAGANLAAAVTLMNRDRDQHQIRLQVLEVPVVDLTGNHLDLRATRALGIPTLVALRELRSVARTYLPDRRAARDPYASPLLATSHEQLPPAVILTAQYDPLRGDGEAYAAALRSAGVDASAVQYLGGTHDTSIFTAVLPAARRWHADVVAALRRLHG